MICKNPKCGKELIPKPKDTFGRINPKTANFCDMKCYQYWYYNIAHPDYYEKYRLKRRINDNK